VLSTEQDQIDLTNFSLQYAATLFPEDEIELLEIQPEHLDELAKLPFHHKDPFD
jgi:PIN domain nuclease of toxin-antitoxin system